MLGNHMLAENEFNVSQILCNVVFEAWLRWVKENNSSFMVMFSQFPPILVRSGNNLRSWMVQTLSFLELFSSFGVVHTAHRLPQLFTLPTNTVLDQ